MWALQLKFNGRNEKQAFRHFRWSRLRIPIVFGVCKTDTQKRVCIFLTVPNDTVSEKCFSHKHWGCFNRQGLLLSCRGSLLLSCHSTEVRTAWRAEGWQQLTTMTAGTECCQFIQLGTCLIYRLNHSSPENAYLFWISYCTTTIETGDMRLSQTKLLQLVLYSGTLRFQLRYPYQMI